MLPLILGLGGAAVGAIRGHEQQRRAQEIEDQSRKMHAAQVRYSPWTERTNFTPIQYAGGSQLESTLGGALQGGMSGAAFAQGLGQSGNGAADVNAARNNLAENQGMMQRGSYMSSENPYAQDQGGFSTWGSMKRKSLYDNEQVTT